MIPIDSAFNEPLVGRSGDGLVALYRRSAVVRLVCDVLHLALGVFCFWLCWQCLKWVDDPDLDVKGFVCGVGFTAMCGLSCFISVDKRWGWNFLFLQDLASWMEDVTDRDGDGDGGDGGDGGD